jgi:hypothetical protein
MPDEFIPPPAEPQMPPGGARGIPDLGKPEDDTEYVDPLDAE